MTSLHVMFRGRFGCGGLEAEMRIVDIGGEIAEIHTLARSE
jgi:hypothetical protein